LEKIRKSVPKINCLDVSLIKAILRDNGNDEKRGGIEERGGLIINI